MFLDEVALVQGEEATGHGEQFQVVRVLGEGIMLKSWPMMTRPTERMMDDFMLPGTPVIKKCRDFPTGAAVTYRATSRGRGRRN